MEFFRKVKATCAAEFMTYVNCMEKSSGDMQFYECRRTQAIYDKCVKEKMGLERPHYGYHCLPKVNLDISKVHILYIPSQIHDTDRPAPKEEKPAWMENEKVYQPCSMKTIFVISVLYGVLMLSFTKQLFHAGEEAW